MEYDVIGDIHGKAAQLQALLGRLGYTARASGWKPPNGRQAVFVGDLIDRGEEQLRVVDTVRRMIDNGDALCILGNHELNAIGWVEPDPLNPGEFLREHSARNASQHREFLRQVGEGSPLHAELVRWFATLPTHLDLGGIRVVHAWWNPDYVALARELQGNRPLQGELLHEAFRKGSRAWQAWEGLTKGCEMELPAGSFFTDTEGFRRHKMRAQWWREDARTWHELAVVDEAQRDLIPDEPLPASWRPTPIDGAPVFVGHYWLTGPQRPLTDKLACLDYSAARGGPLVAYRWQGESRLTEKGFIGVDGP